MPSISLTPSIVVVGDDWRQSIASYITGELQSYFKITRVESGAVEQRGEGAPLLLVCLESLRHLSLEQGVLVLGPKARLLKSAQISSSCYAVADSSNQKQLEWLADHHLKTISCGLSPKDTLTFSSKQEDMCAVSLQRTLTLRQRKIEPQELLFEHQQSQLDFYPILAAAACSLLTGARKM